ncbi:peptidylprolyl isomerase [Salinibacterium sp. ZJ450]|uniref:peptidylprolyl isomerase n=1 Tax=Salinibacterium sp. ZJ450 TaxID=2708338 RepID=UPI001CD7E89C|nr:peptidylprolyl isomerase [Salinibacterium sp. ZJ450]
MAKSTNQDRDARDRLRRYQARHEVHVRQLTRRKRDNVAAIIGLLVIATVVTVAQVLYFTQGPGTPEPAASASATPTPEATGENTGEVPDPALAENRAWTGELVINDIPLGIQLDGAAAPQGVSAFLSLAQSGFYDGTTCHRLTNGGFFVLQCGDPEGTGAGGPDFRYGPVENAPADDLYPAGTIAMARQGGDAFSMGSQFFIVYDETTIPADAAGGYTVLGQVTSGLDAMKAAITDAGIVDGATDGAPVVPTTITGVTLQ